MSSFDRLIDLKRNSGFVYQDTDALAVFAPDLGARIFCELRGIVLHRLDIENVLHPNRPFNNYGGNNFWPAPEGGRFGFNYDGDTWRVQTAINDQPFVLDAAGGATARAVKETTLINRLGTALDVVMHRTFTAVPVPARLGLMHPASAFAYEVEDGIEVRNIADLEDALIGCWTLEQFEATDTTISFARVDNPSEAINYDFYENPGERIAIASRGFFYRTDGRKRGQIGITKKSRPDFVGFYDLQRRLLCVREIVQEAEGVYFNIADNDQPQGPFSAQDVYSIFNGDESLGFFELETVGGAHVENGHLKGSRLVSRTSFALFDEAEPIRQFVSKTLERGED